MTTEELNTIVQAVVEKINEQVIDFDVVSSTPASTDLLSAVRPQGDGTYQGVTLKWDDVANAVTREAKGYRDEAASAKTNVENMKASVDQTVSDFNTLAEQKKAEVQGVYQTDLNELKGDLGELVAENNALKVEVARNRRQIENLNDRLDGDIIENKYKMTGETPDDAGVLSLPSSKLLPFAEVDEVHGRTVVWNQLVDQSFLRTIKLSINQNLAICQSVVGHIYLIIFKASSNSTIRLKSGTVTLKYMDSNTPSDISSVHKISGESIFFECPYGGVITITTFTIIDLTILFGVTEVAQVTDWMKAWVRAYAEAHPQYDAGSLLSARIVSVESKKANGESHGIVELPSIELKEGDTYYPSTGMLSETWGEIDLSTLSWTMTGERYVAEVPNKATGNGIISDSYQTSSKSGYSVEIGSIAGDSSNNKVYVGSDTTPTGTMVYNLATPVEPHKVTDPIDNGLAIESNGTISVISEGTQAEAMIHYAIDNRSTT